MPQPEMWSIDNHVEARLTDRDTVRNVDCQVQAVRSSRISPDLRRTQIQAPDLPAAMRNDKILELAKGYRGRAKNCVRIARERVEKALQYQYRDRRQKKRDMRSLWIEQINAGTRHHGVSPCLIE